MFISQFLGHVLKSWGWIALISFFFWAGKNSENISSHFLFSHAFSFLSALIVSSAMERFFLLELQKSCIRSKHLDELHGTTAKGNFISLILHKGADERGIFLSSSSASIIPRLSDASLLIKIKLYFYVSLFLFILFCVTYYSGTSMLVKGESVFPLFYFQTILCYVALFFKIYANASLNSDTLKTKCLVYNPKIENKSSRTYKLLLFDIHECSHNKLSFSEVESKGLNPKKKVYEVIKGERNNDGLFNKGYPSTEKYKQGWFF